MAVRKSLVGRAASQLARAATDAASEGETG